jgi:hypothetical protein
MHTAADQVQLAMSVDINVWGERLTGTLKDGKGVFQHKDGSTYIGQVQAHGFGVLRAHGFGVYRQFEITHSGEWFGGRSGGELLGGTVSRWNDDRWNDGGRCSYQVGKLGKKRAESEQAEANGSCFYFNSEPCAADDARFVALKAATLTLEVRHHCPRR